MDRNLAEERELVEKAQKDPELFAPLYRLYFGRIYGYTLKRVGNVEAAQDITSEVFMKAFRNLDKFTWREYGLSPWLFRIAVNEINSYFSKSQKSWLSFDYLRERFGFDVPGEQGPEFVFIKTEDSMERQESMRVVLEHLSTLPLRYQEVISLRYLAGKSTAEIGQILGKNESTVRSLLTRGTRKLAEKTVMQQK